MRSLSDIRIVAWVAVFVSLLSGPAFGLTNITVTSSPYSAKPDDGTNDAPAFTSALNAIAAAGGGTLSVPCGNYDFTSKVTVDLHAANVTILGDGAGITTIRCASNNTDGVFLFNNTSSGSQLTLKDFTIEAHQLGGTGVAVYNPTLSTNAICSLRMDDVVIAPAVDQVQYFTIQVDATNLTAPVFYNVMAYAATRDVGVAMTGFRVINADSPTFEQTYSKHIATGYLVSGVRGKADFYRSYTSDVLLGYDLTAAVTNATLSMRHFHSGAYEQGLDITGFGQVEILEHMCFGPGTLPAGVSQFHDQVFTDCSNVYIKGTIYHAMFDYPRTMISLRGTTHDVYIESCLFNAHGTVLEQDPDVRGVVMIGCHDNSQNR